MPEMNSQPKSQSSRPKLEAYRLELQQALAQYRRSETRWSWLRLTAFLASVVAIVAVTLIADFLLACAIAAPVLAVFCLSVWRHLHWRTLRVTTDRILVIVAESLQHVVEQGAPVRNWARPRDAAEPPVELPAIVESGSTWLLTDQERDDLDVYSPPVGLFGLLNRTSTGQGARRLRDMLDGPCLSAEPITQRQQAVRWLDEHDKQRLAVMASALPLRKRSEKLDELARRLRQTMPEPSPTVSKCIKIWSALSGLLFFYALLQIMKGHFGWINPLVLLIVANALIAFFNRAMIDRLRQAVTPLVPLASALRGLLAIAQCATENLPNQTQLDALRERSEKVLTEGQIPSLCQRLGWMGLGGLARSLLNVIVFYDLHVSEAILARFVSSQKVLLEGLAATAEFEALASLACFASEQPVTCYPTFVSETMLSIERGRHPLLDSDDSTPNDVHLTGDERMWIITGPNAAGKSTYLRMVGVNLLLAHVGSAVAAETMTLCPVRLMTDVRVRDDLAKHESYFLSEVRRLRRIVEDKDTATPLFGLIDEPFRGTNSSERTAAGTALTEHLIASGHLFLLATHEEMLAQIAAASNIAANHHFQEHLTEEGIAFDYQLRPGPAVTKTAIRILEQERYPQTLLQRARDLMNAQSNPGADRAG